MLRSSSTKAYVSGAVREFGNLSFSRIYNAGHLVPAYQPETAFTVFTRVIEGVDVGLGVSIDLSTFGTEGDANATHTNNAPPMHNPTCFVRTVNETCSTDQRNVLAKWRRCNHQWRIVHCGERLDASCSQCQHSRRSARNGAHEHDVQYTTEPIYEGRLTKGDL